MNENKPITQNFPDSALYFECHITIAPVFGYRLEKAKELGEAYYFRVADLLMQKQEEDTPTRSKYDTFLTGRHKNYKILEARMYGCIYYLKNLGFQVWRFKIEDTLLDSKLQPELQHIVSTSKQSA